MADIKQQIEALAPKHNELIAILNNTDYAESALAQQMTQIENLKRAIADADQRIVQCEKQTRKEQSDVERYKESSIVGALYKIRGNAGKQKHANRIEKEEQEYLEARKREEEQRASREALVDELRKAEEALVKYQQDNNSRAAAQSELDTLYDNLFTGSTPAYPDEDKAETSYNDARTRYSNAVQLWNSIVQAQGLLVAAQSWLNNATMAISQARTASMMDVQMQGGQADMLERNALMRAHGPTYKVQTLVYQARQVYPQGVQDIGPLSTPQGGLWGDLVSDSLSGDIRFHSKIEMAYNQYTNAQRNLAAQVANLNQQMANQKQTMAWEQNNVAAARKHLQDMRKWVFSVAMSSRYVGGQRVARSCLLARGDKFEYAVKVPWVRRLERYYEEAGRERLT